VFSLVLLIGIPIEFVTGLISYAAYNPRFSSNDPNPKHGLFGLYLFDWLTSPTWIYRLTEGIHVILGLALVPVVLAKLWSVIPKLFAWPSWRSVAQILERVSLILVVGGVVFEMTTGILDIDYLATINFYSAHFFGAWAFIAGFVVHTCVKFGDMLSALRSRRLRTELRTGLADTQPEGVDDGLVPLEPAAPTISRRGVLALVGGTSLVVFLLTAGDTIGGFMRRFALFGTHYRSSGPAGNDFPVDYTAAGRQITASQTGPDWRLVLVGTHRRKDGRQAPTIHTNYRALAATSSPATFDDTGQRVYYAEDNSGCAFVIANGRLTQAAGSDGRAYRSTHPSGNVTRIGGRFTFDGTYNSATDGVAVVLASTNTVVINTNLIPPYPTYIRYSAHLYINPVFWDLSKVTCASGSAVNTSMIRGQFSKQLTCDGVTEYEAEIFINVASSTAYVRLPDGTVQSVTDPDIASWIGGVGFHECISGLIAGGAQVVVPGFTETWADNATYYDLLSRTQLMRMSMTTATMPIASAEGWSTTQTWTGVPLADLARRAGIERPGHAQIESLNSLTVTLSASQVLAPDSMLALRVNGSDLSLDHGFPARVMVPAAPGSQNLKWIAQIAFSEAS